MKDVKWLVQNAPKSNLTDLFDDSELNKIGSDVIRYYQTDKASRSDWVDKVEKGMKVAKQEIETKTFPWAGCANTKDPLIAVAAIQYMSRASAELVRGQDVVKTEVIGEDNDGLKTKRGKRVSQYMSWQCLNQMTEWLPDTDQLLTSQSIIGMYYKKTWWDDVERRICSRSLSPLRVIVNEEARDMDTAPRISYELDLLQNEVRERVALGIWQDITEYLPKEDDGDLEHFVEQICTLDLDDDGYREPYIVTVHLESQRVCRIMANYLPSGVEIGNKNNIVRIKANQHYTEFPFLPSFDGKFHKTGWASLLGPITEEINTLTNQITDAGTLANTPPMFIGKGARLPAGVVRASPGRFIPIETPGNVLRDNIVIPPFVGPSGVLFSLLGRLDDKASKLAAVTDAMTGEMPQDNVPATTTLALLEQGLKVLTNVMKRQYRAFKSEFEKIYRLNYYYLTDRDYLKVLDLSREELMELGITDPKQVEGNSLVKQDFDLDSCDIIPVMDPSAASEAIRLAKANAVHQAAPGNPEALKIYFKAIGIPEADIAKIVPDNQGPSPDAIKMQADIVDKQTRAGIETRRVETDHIRASIEAEMAPARIQLLEAQALQAKTAAELNLAQSESAQVLSHVTAFRAELDAMQAKMEAAMAQDESEIEGKDGSDKTGAQPGGSGGVEGGPDNQENPSVPGPEAGPVQGGMEPGAVPMPDSGGNGPADNANAGDSPGFRVYPDHQPIPGGEQ